MKVVIQCASKKQANAGHLCTTLGKKKKIMFVARPDDAPPVAGQLYARPDDISTDGKSWRTVLEEYNAAPADNPDHLLPAWQLYADPTYRMLTKHCGLDGLYILSAGWGLIRADFLTPKYDITFSSKVARCARWKRRYKKDVFRDFSMLPADTTEPITFLGGKAYVDLFCELTESVKAPRLIWYKSKKTPNAPGCDVELFRTTRRQNWYYTCAKALVDGSLKLPRGYD